MNIQINPSGQPFYLAGGRTGVLLVHGFTSTPNEMRWLAQSLNKQGLSCLGIRLPGHATSLEDLRMTKWTDWTSSIADGYQLLRNRVDRIFLVGLSMGGALSLLMSTRLDVAGVIALSTPCRLPKDYPNWILSLYGTFVPEVAKSTKTLESSWFDKTAFAEHFSYPKNPVRSVIELKSMLREMKTVLPTINKPVLLIHSKDDKKVPPSHLTQIFKRLPAAIYKSKRYISGSGHVVTSDAAREVVFQSTLEFIQKFDDSQLFLSNESK